ncbi:MAG TPA: hypothetical protein VGX92_07800 [Pyrinomonadaceae bacterium]|jgi:hypothetical protein|nr:hypothetical protein [Pyrinomonadaceae bacterium]
MAEDDPNTTTTPDGGQSVLPADIRESIALGSFTSISGQPSSLSSLAYSNSISNNNLTQQNTVANQQAMNQVGQSVLGTTVNLVANLSPMEAVATVKLDTGNDVAQQLADIKGTLAAFTSPTNSQPLPPLRPRPPKPIPLPTVKIDPQGSLAVTARAVNFPLSLVIDDSIATFSVERDSPTGTLINVNSRHFPVALGILGSNQAEVQTVVNVSSGKFPLQVRLGQNLEWRVVEQTNGWTIMTGSEKKFPVRVKLS